MEDKKRILYFMAVLALACTMVAFISIHILYKVSVTQQKEWLQQTVQSRSRTIETMYEHDLDTWKALPEEKRTISPFDATLQQLKIAHARFEGFGKTGEFTLAKREGDQIVFLLSHRHDGPQDTQVIQVESQLAEPMRRALDGKSGVMVDMVDYRGEKVLAAYEHVEGINLGLVVKKDMKEVRAPFVKAGKVVGTVSVLIIFFGALIIGSISNPLIRKLETYSKNLEQEIEERKTITEALKENEEWLFTVLSSIGDAVIATDVNSKIKFINKVSERMTGWKSQDAVGKHIDEVFVIINENSRKTVPTPIEKVLETGRIMGLANHTLLISKDGTEYPISDSAAPIKNLGGKVTGVVLVFQDDTEKKKTQQQILQMQKMESLGTLAGGIAHDFNNMLAVIMGGANMLMMDVDENHPNYIDIHAIMDASRKAKELTMKLLTFSRKDKINVQNVKASEIIENIGIMLNRTVEKNIRVQAFIRDDCVIQVDANQVQQALLNVCNNAADSMPDGGDLIIECMITDEMNSNCTVCGKSFSGKYCVIQVSDQGVGIPKEIISRVIEPFFTTKGVGKGTGLGLSVSHGILEAHNGHMHIYSEPGKGTCVKLYLPHAESQVVADRREAKKENLTGNETILVVDDEPGIRYMTERILKAMGYKTILAAGGLESIEIFKEKRSEIDVIILDLMMPVMDGAQVFNVLKELDPEVKVILASGYSITGKASSVMSLGAKKFVQKPFMLEDLCKAIRELMDEKPA